MQSYLPSLAKGSRASWGYLAINIAFSSSSPIAGGLTTRSNLEFILGQKSLQKKWTEWSFSWVRLLEQNARLKLRIIANYVRSWKLLPTCAQKKHVYKVYLTLTTLSVNIFPPKWISLNLEKTTPWKFEKIRLAPLGVRHLHGRQESFFHHGYNDGNLYTLQGINISHLGKRKIIFKMPFLGDMLVPWRVYIESFHGSCFLASLLMIDRTGLNVFQKKMYSKHHFFLCGCSPFERYARQ